MKVLYNDDDDIDDNSLIIIIIIINNNYHHLCNLLYELKMYMWYRNISHFRTLKPILSNNNNNNNNNDM